MIQSILLVYHSNNYCTKTMTTTTTRCRRIALGLQRQQQQQYKRHYHYFNNNFVLRTKNNCNNNNNNNNNTRSIGRNNIIETKQPFPCCYNNSNNNNYNYNRLLQTTRTLTTTSTKETITQQITTQQQQLNGPNNNNNISWLGRSWRNGNILLGIGYTGLVLFGIDLYLQYIQNLEKRSSYQIMVALQEETAIKRREIYEQYKNHPTLYQCIVQTEYKNMGGINGIQNIQLYDLVDVLEENVGPDGYYDLCRIYEKDDGITIKSIGWYPKKYLQRLETPKTSSNGIIKKLLFWKKSN